MTFAPVMFPGKCKYVDFFHPGIPFTSRETLSHAGKPLEIILDLLYQLIAFGSLAVPRTLHEAPALIEYSSLIPSRVFSVFRFCQNDKRAEGIPVKSNNGEISVERQLFS